MHPGPAKRQPTRSRPRPTAQCDLLLVDGAHDAKSVHADILAMRKLAARDAMLLIEDVAGVGNGLDSALRRAAEEGVVRIESWNEYITVHSRRIHAACIQRVRWAGREGRWLCPHRWGFAIARYMHGIRSSYREAPLHG